MARVVERSYNAKNLTKFALAKCNNCQSKIGVEQKDVYEGEYGNFFYECPNCGEINEIEGATVGLFNDLNVNTVEYPKHFHYVNELDKDTSNGHITTDIKDMIKILQENVEDFSSITCIDGDTIIVVKRNEEDENWEIYVAKNYDFTKFELDATTICLIGKRDANLLLNQEVNNESIE